MFCSLSVSLLAVELFLRTFYPLHITGFIGAYEYDEQLGAKLKPDIHFTRLTDHLQEVHTNHLGTVNYQESFQGFRKLVFALGDSFTQGTGLASDASYPFQLDLTLNTRSGRYEKEYGVVNLGLSAYGVEQALLALDRYVEIIGKPDYVLWLGCPNDSFDDKLFVEGYRHRGLVDGSPYWGKLLKPVQLFGNYLEVGKRLKIAVSGAQRRHRKSRAADAAMGVLKVNAPLPQAALNRLAERCRGLGSDLYVAWTHYGDEGDSTNSRLRLWAGSQKNVRFVDWRPLVSSVVVAAPQLPVINPHSGGHYRTWVNRSIADAFAREIERSHEPVTEQITSADSASLRERSGVPDAFSTRSGNSMDLR